MKLRADWITVREESPLRVAALLPLVPLAWAYAAGAGTRRALARTRVFRPSHFPGRVISVGSLVVGGAGKTPLTAWLAAALRRRGHRVAIASRGYGGNARDAVVVVSDGRFVRSRAEVAGDEAMVLAAHAPGVPVLIGRDRALVAWRALSAFGADVLVLDDGFQHHDLHRDVDVVCFDGTLGLGNRRLLPRGPLREPLRALRHAHAIGVVDGPLPQADAALLERVAGGIRRFEAHRRAIALRPLRGGDSVAASVLRGREVGLLAGLAHPQAFRRTLESLGARVVAERTFRDHHRYRARDFRGLAARAPLWVTTEKDAVKILPTWTHGADLRVLRIELEVREAETFLDWIDSLLR